MTSIDSSNNDIDIDISGIKNQESQSQQQNAHRKGHRRQESQYEMTGLYSEAQDDSSADLPHEVSESESLPHNEDNNRIHNVTVSTTLANPSATMTTIDTVIKCHSRQPSNSAGLMEKTYGSDAEEEFSKDCGILSCRPVKMQKLARIKVRNLMPKSHLRFHLIFNLIGIEINFVKINLLFLDFCSSFIDASDVTASSQFGIHKFCNYDH